MSIKCRFLRCLAYLGSLGPFGALRGDSGPHGRIWREVAESLARIYPGLFPTSFGVPERGRGLGEDLT